MGFFDSFKNGFEEGNQEAEKRQQYSKYHSEKQQEKEHFNDLNSQSDGALLNKLKGIFISDKDKEIIDKILRSRGYSKATNGTYHRLWNRLNKSTY